MTDSVPSRTHQGLSCTDIRLALQLLLERLQPYFSGKLTIREGKTSQRDMAWWRLLEEPSEKKREKKKIMFVSKGLGGRGFVIASVYDTRKELLLPIIEDQFKQVSSGLKN